MLVGMLYCYLEYIECAIDYTYIYIYSKIRQQQQTFHIKPMISHSPTQTPTEQLYQQFLAYIKGSQKKQLSNTIQQEYKNLYSCMYKSNKKKKALKESKQIKQYNMKSNGCKFTKIEGGYRELEEFKERIVGNQSVLGDVDQNSIQDQILIQQSQYKQLQQQIEHTKSQIQTHTKQIQQIKQKIKQLDLQQPKFRQIQQLATNIGQFTTQHQQITTKNYNKMLEEQQNIISKLKIQRTKVKKQLAEVEHLYNVHQKQHQVQVKKFVKSCMPLVEGEEGGGKGRVVGRGQRKFMEAIQKVLELLQDREVNFQTVKQEECTRLTNRKINKQLLAGDRVQWVQLVQNFQRKFSIRVESSDKILVKLYKQIKLQNQSIQKQIFQHRCLIQDYQHQLSTLLQKQSTLTTPIQTPSSPNKHPTDISLQKLHQNSITCINIMQVTNNLLIKFRYIFKLFIMMNIDKRRLSDQILKLQEILDKKCRLVGGRIMMDGDCKNSGLEDTNARELCEILGRGLGGVGRDILEDVVLWFFNDMRVGLLCRKTMIMQQLTQTTQTTPLSKLLQTMITIQQECEYNYNQKLKQYLKLLHQCFKCSIKTNSTTNSSRSASTTTLTAPTNANTNVNTNTSTNVNANANANAHIQRTNNLLDAQLCLPSGMFPKTKVMGYRQIQDQRDEDEINQGLKSVLNVLAKNMDKEKKPEQWGKEERKNPSVIIRKLLAIRNESVTKFKQLDMHECQKKYIKQSTKQLSNIQANQNINLVKQTSTKTQPDQPISLKSLMDKEKQQQKQKNVIQNKQQCTQYNNFIK